jgi:NAD(P)-dependent dehydrogenase (short-subunit alcohol dehydrogenase family)
MAVELKGAVFGTKYAIREMRKVGGGCILFTSSMVGLRPNPYWPSYSLTYGVAKAGQVMLVRCLTEPLARDNIRINCVCPGPVMTPQSQGRREEVAKKEGISLEEFSKRSIGRIPLGRAFTMDEIVDVALFLVSDRASAITGVALAADGGFAAL